MKNKKTYYHLILDRSGSMNDCVNETISGFNEQVQMIRNLQKSYPEQEFYISLTTFNNTIDHPFMECHVSTIRELDKNSYIPDGGTALLDAIGESVMNLKARKGEEFDRNEATAVVVILTDGHENASRIFDWKSIGKMIRELEDGPAWTFSFLGATRDALEVASILNIRHQNSARFEKSVLGGTMQNINDSLKGYAAEKEKGNTVKNFLKK